MSEENTEEVKDPQGLLKAYNALKEDVKRLSQENSALTQANKDLSTKAEANSESEWKARAIKAETKLALASTGVKDADRLMKYVGTDGLDFDENGNLTGLDERMKQLKADLPELFDVKRRVGGKADIHANSEAPQKQLTPSELQVAHLLNR